jgi:hypothetical protein
MFLFAHPAIRAVAAATLLGAFVLASPSSAASGDLAQASASPSETNPAPAPEESASAAAKAKAAVDAKVDARLKAMHGKLKITAAQDTQWNAVAQAMRENAHAIADLREESAEQAKSMNAIDQIKSYAAITDAQAAGIHKFLPAFQALYDTMSDTQKKAADALFRSRAHAEAKRHKEQ